ncbi:MAG: MATE family efflux transporter [Gammaproteobacteria bacterium]
MKKWNDPLKNKIIAELRNSIFLTVPMVMTSMFGMLLATVDTYVAGTISVEALTAVSVGNSIFWLVAVPLIAILNSMDVFFSRAFGANDKRNLDDCLVQSFWLSLCLIIISIPLVVLVTLAYQLTNITDTAFAGVTEYVKGLLPSMVLILLCVPLEKYWNCQNRVFLWTTLSIVLLPVNYFFDVYISTEAFNGLGLGVYGIGLTTTLCNGINLVAVAIYTAFVWKRNGGFLSTFQPPNIHFLKKVLKIGLPASGQEGTDVLGFSLLNYMAAFFGNAAVAAHQVVFIISTIFYMISSGWSDAASIRIGYYLGAKQFRFAAKLGTLNMMFIGVVFVFFSVGVWLYKYSILSLFLDAPELVNMAADLLSICVFMMTANAIQCLKGGTMRAWGDSSKAFYTNLFAFYAVGLPVAYYLAFYTNAGIRGIWIGLLVIMIVCAFLNILLWFYVIKKYPFSRVESFSLVKSFEN